MALTEKYAFGLRISDQWCFRMYLSVLLISAHWTVNYILRLYFSESRGCCTTTFQARLQVAGQPAADPGKVPRPLLQQGCKSVCPWQLRLLSILEFCFCWTLWGCFLETTQLLLIVDSEEKMGKEGGNKEVETGREPVSLILAADQVERKYSLSVPHPRATSTSSPPRETKHQSDGTVDLFLCVTFFCDQV